MVIGGSGGNGGGGMTAARRLLNWGYNVDILLTSDQARLKGTIKNQLNILKNIHAKIYTQENFDYNNNYDIILDAMIGYSLRGSLRQNIIELIGWVNIQNGTTISLDVPSGIDSTTGNILSTCIKADYTMTLALPKIGFKTPNAKPFIGKLLLADISVPPTLYSTAFDIDANDIFSKSDIVEIS